MPLKVDLTNIKNSDEICFVGDDFHGYEYSEVTNYLVFTGQALGVSEITEKNYVEVAARHEFLNKGQVTLEDVKKHIGLKLNVADESNAKWLRRISKSQFNDIVRKYTN